MIIVANKSGQLCNQLVLFAHAFATAMESNQRIRHIFGYSLNQYFDFDHEFRKLILHRDIQKISWCLEYLKYREYKRFKKIKIILLGRDLKVPSKDEMRKTAQQCRKKGIHIISYWQYRDYEALFLHQDKIRKIFKPRQHICEEVNDIIKAMNKLDHEVYIAVHMRRGDYKTWCNGRFYFSNETYKRWMQDVAKSCNKRCVFVLFSNEKIEQEVFADYSYKVIVAKGDTIHDLYTMASCDYIMGPPSTFSWWAAFYGHKLYCTLYDEQMKVSLKQFRHVEGEEFNPFKYLES